jgi:hypothetical protein
VHLSPCLPKKKVWMNNWVLEPAWDGLAVCVTVLLVFFL